MQESFKVYDVFTDFITIQVAYEDFLGNISDVVRGLNSITDEYMFYKTNDSKFVHIEFYTATENVKKAWAVWAAIRMNE